MVDREDIAPPSAASISIWYVATADGPVTALEISETAGLTRGSVQCALYRLAADHRVMRRKRDTGTSGPNPYEYRLASRDEHRHFSGGTETEDDNGD